MNKTDRNIPLMIVATVCLVFVVLITSMQLLCFEGTGWYEHEFDKYSVLEDVRGEELSMEDALGVMENLQSYIMGDEPELCDFFSEREATHLADCRELFEISFKIRNVLALVLLVCALVMVVRKSVCARAYWVTLGVLIALGVALAAASGWNFVAVFEKFHLNLFSNDLWLLDPRYDNLINLLPLGFFKDTVRMCLGVSGIILAATGLLLKACERRIKK